MKKCNCCRMIIVFSSLLCAISISSAFGFAGGDGTAGNPYQISTRVDLEAVNNHLAAHYILINDIDMTGEVYSNALIAPETHNSTNYFDGIPFTGVFDGAEHDISNLKISGGQNDFIGLFGKIENGAEIKNLNIVGCNMSGRIVIGGIAGRISESMVTNCSSTGTIGGDLAGGLVGSSQDSSTITFCCSAGKVSGYETVGGLVGTNSSIVKKCYSSATVSGYRYVGGLVGHNGAVVGNSYSNGSVGGDNGVGGLIGFVSYGDVTQCYSSGSVSGYDDYGGLIGKRQFSDITKNYFLDSAGPHNGLGTPLSESAMKQQSSFIDWNFTIWKMFRENEDYPRLAWQLEYAGDIAGLYGIDLVDFSYLTRYWGLGDCGDLSDCGRADVDQSGTVDIGDLIEIANNWLEGK